MCTLLISSRRRHTRFDCDWSSDVCSFFCKQKTAYEIYCDWSSDVCSSDLLGSGAISLMGSDALRQRYLPRVARGEAIAAFALSEPDAGSDVAAMACEARLEGDHYVLNGAKTWISNGGIADFYCVFARTGEAPGARGISRSEEHTSELQSQSNLVCRLLLEKKKNPHNGLSADTPHPKNKPPECPRTPSVYSRARVALNGCTPLLPHGWQQPRLNPQTRQAVA